MILLFISIVFSITSTTSADYFYETKYIEVPIDHFSFTSNDTFKLRYLLNGRYHVKGGPIFVYTGNEGDVTIFAKNTGFLYDIAPIFNALIVFIEHRYYGESLPFGNKSLSTLENLKYLNSAQALRDFVYLINDLKKTYLSTMLTNDTYPFVAFGGSYGGMLAAWLRMKYPDVVVGAVAASAPIWTFDGLVTCEKIYDFITELFEKFGSERCTKIIRMSWNAIRNFTKSLQGKERLSNLWNLCNNLKNDSDIDSLVDWLSNIYFNMAMCNYPYPTNFMATLPAYPVKIFCDKLSSSRLNSTLQLMESLGKALVVYTNYTGKTKCNDINSSYTDPVDRAWEYQSCTELVMPMCSTDKDMFETEEWDLKNFSAECFKKFGTHTLYPQWPVLEYGGKNLRYFSNIVFSNGLQDPWSVGGVLHNISQTIWSVNVTDGAHHVDLRGADPTDNNYVIEARKFHVKAIKKWLNIF